MKPISAAVVEQTRQRVAQTDPADAPAVTALMNRQQPAVLAYLRDVGGDFLNEDEQDLLFYIGTVVWQVMRQGERKPRKVNLPALDRAERRSMRRLESVVGKPESAVRLLAESLVQDAPQPEVLRYVLGALMGEHEEGLELRDDRIGMMFVYLNAVLEALNT